MNPALLALFSLLNPEHLAQLTADSVGVYATVAHGDGGLAKVLSAVQGLGKLLEDAVSGAVPQATVTPPVITPAPPAA